MDARTKIIQLNDQLRTTFQGGLVLMTPAVYDLVPELRGRAFYRLTQYQRFDQDSLHDRGVFIFAGYSFIWYIDEFAGERAITLSLNEDWLGVR